MKEFEEMELDIRPYVGESDTDYRSEEELTPPIVKGKRRSASYAKREDLSRRIIFALAHGRNTEWVIEQINDGDYPRVTKQLIQYYKQIALDKGIIVEDGLDEEGFRFKYYRKGPNFYLLKFKDWTKFGTEPLLCRIHASRGNSVQAMVKVSTEESIDIIGEDGKSRKYRIFEEGKRSYGVYKSTYQLLIPFSVIGYHKAYATLHRKYIFSTNYDVVYISPPEIRYSLDQLIGGDAEITSYVSSSDRFVDDDVGEFNPFRGSIEYALSTLESSGWVFHDLEVDHSYHYAFDMNMVKKYYPALAEGVPVYNGYKQEDNLIIYQDKSHGHRELETTDRWLAIEIMTLLEFTRQRVRGEKRYPRANTIDSTKSSKG